MSPQEAYQILYDRLMGFDRLLLTTHRNPDPDGLGAEIALYNLLLEKGKGVVVLNNDPLPYRLQFLDKSRIAYNMKENAVDFIGNDIHVVMLDNSDVSRTGEVQRFVKEDKSNLTIIDHHDKKEPDYISEFQFPGVSSIAEVAYELFMISGAKMNLSVATGIYTGIVSDTGHFRFRKTTARTHEIAAHMLNEGVRPDFISEKLLFNSPSGKLKLKQLLYSTLETNLDENIAYFRLHWSDLARVGISYDDLDGVVNELIEIATIRVGILFTEREPGKTKVSIRSKADDDMLPVVSEYGGGGHKNACGATLSMAVGTAIHEVIPLVERELQKTGKQN